MAHGNIGTTSFFLTLVPCSSHTYGLIGLKPARWKESAARTGFVNPLSRRDAADGRFKANPSGGGQGAAGFVARRQRMHPYAILLASRPQPLGPPSTRNYDRNRALGPDAGVTLLTRRGYCIVPRAPGYPTTLPSVEITVKPFFSLTIIRGHHHPSPGHATRTAAKRRDGLIRKATAQRTARI